MTTETNKSFVTIYTEATPNPETMKFVANRMILALDSADFPTKESAVDVSPLALKLFEFNFVNGVFIMNNFVTVTRKPEVVWDEVAPILREYIKAWLDEGRPVVTKTESVFDENDSEPVRKIKELLDNHVKPAVEMDGGMISFKSFENGIVTVVMKGSCSGCPSSTITLKSGIENLLKRMVPEVIEVVAEAA
jgi:Fe-S cluster biogenesis protein NfuA